jgi:putative tricarboxylic transport membrane protein
VETLANLGYGFSIALTWQALMICFAGVTLGTFVGVLPGIGALAAISLCLPLTYYMDPTHALIMLAGIFYGAQYGSSTASILLNIPGTPSAAVTCLDGHPMAKQGRAGPALLITTVTSFLGGSFAIILLIAFAAPLTRFALQFGSPEYFAIMLLGLLAASTISVGSPLKGLAMVVFGLVLGLVGTDVTSGIYRFTFGSLELTDGLSLVAVAMGLFGVAEIISNLVHDQHPNIDAKAITLKSLMPTRDDMRRSVMPTVRGALAGSWIGAMPGTGPSIAAFLAYAFEKRVAKDPSRFGKGAVEGIAAPEAANNASVQAAFIPTLCIGIPGDAVMAFMLGAMMIHGIVPGPQFLSEQPQMFWGLVASFWIGNVMLVALNIPLIGLWVRILAIPRQVLYPAILFFICVGVYSVHNNPFDIFVALGFGIVGYLMNAFGYPAAPVLLGFILGPLVEENFRRALFISNGDFGIFVRSPLSVICLLAALLVVVLPIVKVLREKPTQKTDFVTDE